MKNSNSKSQPFFNTGMIFLMVGYSFLKAVAYNSYVTNFTITKGAYGYISDLTFMCSASAGIVVASLVIFILARLRVLKALELNHQIPLLLIALCYIVGPLLAETLDPALYLGGLGFIWGLTITTMGIVWIELFTYEQSPKALIIQLACASCFSAIIGVLVAQFSQVFNVIVCVFLALASIPIISVCRRTVCTGVPVASILAGVSKYSRRLPKPSDIPQNGGAALQSKAVTSQNGGATSQNGVMATFKLASTAVLAYFFFELVVGLINMFAYEGSSSFSISTNAPIQGMFICSILVVLFVFVTSKTPTPSVIYLFVFPGMITVFLILPFFGESLGRPLSSVIYTAYVFTSMLSMFCYVGAIRQTAANAYQVAALINGGLRVMLMIGIGLGYGFSSMLNADTYVRLGITAVVCVYFLGVVILFALWGYRNSRKRKSEAERPAPALTDSYEELVASRVEELAQKFGLTKRERDVLIELSKGNSAARIAQDLFISISTVQGYIKTLYVKLGVNKKQQVLDLVKGVKR